MRKSVPRLWGLWAAALLLVAAAAASRDASDLGPLPPVPVPRDNPQTPEKILLGRRLFFDAGLSKTGAMSCATCHRPERAFTDGRPRTRNPRGKELGRNTMTVINAAYAKSFFWDGRKASLEKQAVEPFINPEEMDLRKEEVVSRVAGDPRYRRQFREAFGDRDITFEKITMAVAAFERTLVSSDSPFDRFHRGDKKALSREALRGLALFQGKGRCAVCHNGPYLSDGKFHNVGVPSAGPWREDPGRQRIDADPASRRKFKTPTLRNAALTGPYMHNGAFETLEDVVEFYDRGGDVKDALDPDIRPLGLTPEEKKALVAFLESLTSLPPFETPEDAP